MRPRSWPPVLIPRSLSKLKKVWEHGLAWQGGQPTAGSLSWSRGESSDEAEGSLRVLAAGGMGISQLLTGAEMLLGLSEETP